MDSELETLGTGSAAENEEDSLDAYSVTEAQYNAIMTEACNQFAHAAASVSVNLEEATDYNKVNDDILKLMQQLSGGRLTRFVQENHWMLKQEAASKFCKSGKNNHDEVIRKVMVDNVELLDIMNENVSMFISYLGIYVADIMRPVYKTIRFFDTMDDLIGDNVYHVIENGFREYTRLYAVYERDSVFDFIHVNKDNWTKADGVDYILNHMDGDIEANASLEALMRASNRNLFYCIDRETKLFKEFAGKQGDMENIIANFKKIEDVLAAISADATHQDMITYCNRFDDVILKLISATEKAIQIIKDFKEKTDAPYWIMKYPDTAKKATVIKKYMQGDPMSEGTNYCTAIKEIVTAFHELADDVWKRSPNEPL